MALIWKTPNGSRTTIYVTATIVAAMFTVGAIVVLAIVRPENTSTATIILGIMLPIITGFLAASIGHLNAAVNGRLTQLLQVTASEAKSEGKLEEQIERREHDRVSS